MRECEVEVPIKGVKTKVKLRSLDAGARNEAIRKSMGNRGMGSGSYNPDMDPVLFNEWRLFFGIVEPASLKSMDAIHHDLEPEDYDKLIDEMNKISEVSPQSIVTSEAQ
jgi:hypothetical protein